MKLIRIESENPDWIGSWTQQEIESDMMETGVRIDSDSTWIEYVLDRVFDSALEQGIADALVRYGGSVITSMTVRLPEGVARLVLA